jgi:hypothetical protein
VQSIAKPYNEIFHQVLSRFDDAELVDSAGDDFRLAVASVFSALMVARISSSSFQVGVSPIVPFEHLRYSAPCPAEQPLLSGRFVIASIMRALTVAFAFLVSWPFGFGISSRAISWLNRSSGCRVLQQLANLFGLEHLRTVDGQRLPDGFRGRLFESRAKAYRFLKQFGFIAVSERQRLAIAA